VLGDVRRLDRPRLEVAGHFGMELARDRRRHRATRCFEDQVVGERAVAQHLRGVELAPGIAQIDRAQAEHVSGEVGAEVGAGDGGAARQLHRRRRQPIDALADQVGDARGGRQAARGRAGGGRPCRHRRQHQLQRLEKEHRVAAGMPGQHRREPAGIERSDAERIDQRADLLGGERLQHLQPRAVRAEKCVVERLRRRFQLVRAEGDDPAQAEACVGQLLQRLDAGGIGELQVVDHQPRTRHRPEPGAVPTRARRRDGRGSRRAAASALPSSGRRCASSAALSWASGPLRRASSRRSRRDSSVCGTRASPGRASTARAPGSAWAKSPTSRDLPRPASPATRLGWPADQSACRRCHSASRPIRRGGRSTLTGSGRGCAVLGRQAAGGDARAQRLGLGVGGDAEGRSSTSQQRSNAASAAARSPRR
jgi:hypothetical protein